MKDTEKYIYYRGGKFNKATFSKEKADKFIDDSEQFKKDTEKKTMSQFGKGLEEIEKKREKQKKDKK